MGAEDDGERIAKLEVRMDQLETRTDRRFAFIEKVAWAVAVFVASYLSRDIIAVLETLRR